MGRGAAQVEKAPEARDEADEAIRPRRPHDDLPFAELARSYNFRQTSDLRLIFARLVIKECHRLSEQKQRPIRVLDIGCGRGIGRRVVYTRAVRRWADELWGIEPDERITPEPGLFDRFQHALMETADLPEGAFDLAYSFMVMEHVADPRAFLCAVFRSLKPGGVYLFLTPNARHYFTISASILHKVKLDEAVLCLLKPSTRQSYHYPVYYKCNSERRIRAEAQRAGFSDFGAAFLEPEGPTGYLRGPLKPVFHAMRLKRRLVRNPRILLALAARLEKAGAEPAGARV